MRMPVGPFYSSDILSGPLALYTHVPMLQSASEHGRNEISRTAMRIDSRPPQIKRKRHKAPLLPPVRTAISRRVRSDPRPRAIDFNSEFSLDGNNSDNVVTGAGRRAMAHKGNYGRYE